MISVTPFAPADVSAQRKIIIRTTVIAAVALTALAVVTAKLANVTGDTLAAIVLVLAGLATAMALLAPKNEGAKRHG